MPSLLDKARQIKTKPQMQITPEMVELAQAVLTGEISANAFAKVLSNGEKDLSGGWAYPVILNCLKIAYKEGKLKIVE